MLQPLREEKYQAIRKFSSERTIEAKGQSLSWWSNPLSWSGRGQGVVKDSCEIEPAKKEKAREFKKK